MSGNKLQPRKKSSFLKYKPFFSLLDTIDLTRFLPLTGIVEIDNQRFNVNMKIELSALLKKKKIQMDLIRSTPVESHYPRNIMIPL